MTWGPRGSEHSRQVSGEGGTDANRNLHSMAMGQATPWCLDLDVPCPQTHPMSEDCQALVRCVREQVGPKAAGLAPTQIPWQCRAGPSLPSYIIIPSLPAWWELSCWEGEWRLFKPKLFTWAQCVGTRCFQESETQLDPSSPSRQRYPSENWQHTVAQASPLVSLVSWL